MFGSLELTYACNLACKFCYNPIQRKGQGRAKEVPPPEQPPLTFDEYLRILDEFKEMGVLYLTLTGGEPLLHPRFWDIARAAKERTFALRIFSNGIAIDEKVADRLQDLAPFCVELSIHGTSDATAEALNQVKGSHTRFMRALRLLRERDITVFIKCVVTRLVENELEDILKLGLGFGYGVYFDPILYQSMDGEEYPFDLRASDEAIARLYRTEGINVGNSPFEGQAEFNCGVGSGVIHVDPHGYLHPCLQWSERIGNVRERTLKDMWENSARIHEIRELNRTLPAHVKGTVEEHAFCFHCPAFSMRESGDPMKVGEQHLRVAKIKSDVHKEETARATVEGHPPAKVLAAQSDSG